VRNGNRWRVVGVDARTNWLGAERLDDGARVVFDGDYLQEHVGLGYAVTVHSAQGVTADTSHAVLGENTSRALLYVALTRGRDNNTAHLYQRTSGDHEPGVQEADGTHVKHRGDSHEADLIGGILTNTTSLRSPHTTTPPAPQARLYPTALGASSTVEGPPYSVDGNPQRLVPPKHRITFNPRAGPVSTLPALAGTIAQTAEWNSSSPSSTGRVDQLQ
jgi:hypothetical protein